MGELTVTTFDIMDKLDEAASGPRFLSSGHNSKESTPAGDNFAGKVFLVGLTNTYREIRNKYVIGPERGEISKPSTKESTPASVGAASTASSSSTADKGRKCTQAFI